MRTPQLLRRLIAIPAASLLIAATVAPTSATDNVNLPWEPRPANGYDHWVTWAWDTTTPQPQGLRDYIINGRMEWNNVGRELYFAYDPFSSIVSLDIRVGYEDLLWPHQDMLAIAQYWYFNGQITQGKILFNTTPGDYQHWYGQAPLACNYVDAWSTAAHEFGHLVSLNHSGTDADTMYPLIWCGDTSDRSLTTHDQDGIKQFYPAH